MKYVTMLWFHHRPCGIQGSLTGKENNTAQGDNKTYRK